MLLGTQDYPRSLVGGIEDGRSILSTAFPVASRLTTLQMDFAQEELRGCGQLNKTRKLFRIGLALCPSPAAPSLVLLALVGSPHAEDRGPEQGCASFLSAGPESSGRETPLRRIIC